MNPFFNPIFLYRSSKALFSDPDRLKKTSKSKLKIYQNKQLRKIVKYAYEVPMYRIKYKKAKVKPEEIKTTDDLHKLPFISKEDLRKYEQNQIVPKNFNRDSAMVGRTGGTSGEPIVVYLDYYTVIKSMLSLIRTMKEYDVRWNKTKMALILDLSENSFENAYFVNSISSFIKPFFRQNNMQIFDQKISNIDLIKKIENFRPELLAGYPFSINELALLKKSGYGKNLNPRLIMTSGQFLDENVRDFIEKTFETKIYDSYISTETGPIAFECIKGNYHIHSDMIYPEFIKNGENVEIGKPGEFIVTKLQGYGTPLIRYTGLGDVVSSEENSCNCGISSFQLKRIHGRKINSIYLPNGRIVLPSFMEKIFSEIYLKSKVNKQKRTQIIQHDFDKIEIKIQFDKKLRNVGVSTEELFKIMKNKMKKVINSDIEIFFTETKDFEENAPYIISKIDTKNFFEKKFIV